MQLYAKGISSLDIVYVIEKLYVKKLSPQQVLEITKEVEEERIVWEKRRLKKRCTVIFIDALFFKVRRDKASSDAVYLVA